MLKHKVALGLLLVWVLLAASPAGAALSLTRSDLVGSWYDYYESSSLYFTLYGDGTGFYQDEDVTWVYTDDTITLTAPETANVYAIPVIHYGRGLMVVSFTYTSIQTTVYRILKFDNSPGHRANFTTRDLVGAFEYTNDDGTKYTFIFYADGSGVQQTSSTGDVSFTWSYSNPMLNLVGNDLRLIKSGQLEPASFGDTYTYTVILLADDYLTIVRDNGDMLTLKEK
ncbi:MAG: hypothetical protein JRC92_11825 [Deltaproteobacteria bacterium]|nr:hypothetical protein [Deltaproteobacteria bacterium]